MNIKKIPTKILAMFFMAFLMATGALVGCGTDGEPDAEPTTEVASELRNGGGGPVGYICSDGLCRCMGEADCNNMFGSGRCGGFICSECDESGPVVSCWCEQSCNIVWSPW